MTLLTRKQSTNVEVYVEHCVATIDPRNPKNALIGIVLRERADLNLLSDPMHAGEYIQNKIIVNPTTKEQIVSHIQQIDLQTLNDIIECSNETKLANHTGQRILKKFTPQTLLEYAHKNQPLITLNDEVAFVCDLV